MNDVMNGGMNDDLIYRNWLYSVAGIGRIKYRKLMDIFGSGAGIYERCRLDPASLEAAAGDGISKGDIDRIRKHFLKCNPQALWEKLKKQGIEMMDETSPDFPARLLNIPDRPAVLYQIGKEGKKPGEGPALAVIGSRICTEYGRMVAKRIGGLCARMGIELVSGMAVGIDGIAQRAALEEGGSVTAVLGSGVDVCYPRENRELYEGLCQRGRIISEYNPGIQPVSGNYPPRNRIISGLSDAVIVVEAREKSGTMITVDMALDQGKQVYIIPGRLTDPLSAGCNRLISQGADIVWNLGECLEKIYAEYVYAKGGNTSGFAVMPGACDKGLLGIDKSDPETEAEKMADVLGKNEAVVYEALDYEGRTLQEIYERINERYDMPYSCLQGILLELELKGLAGSEGTRFRLKPGGL